MVTSTVTPRVVPLQCHLAQVALLAGRQTWLRRAVLEHPLPVLAPSPFVQPVFVLSSGEPIAARLEVARRGADPDVGVREAVACVQRVQSGQRRRVRSRLVDLTIDAHQAQVQHHGRCDQEQRDEEREHHRDRAALVARSRGVRTRHHLAVHVVPTVRP